MEKYFKLSSLILTVLLIIGCSGETKIDSDKVHETGSVCRVSGFSEKVSGNSLQMFNYSWENTESISDYKDLMVKVHFVNSNGDILFQDDHKLPNRELSINYTREILIPLIPKTQTVNVMVGLFIPGSPEKLLIRNSENMAGKKVITGKFMIVPPRNLDDLPEARISFKEGWYEKEYGQSALESWRWMGPQARCQLRGAERELQLFIRGWIPPENRTDSITITMDLDGEEIGSYSSLEENFIIKRTFSTELIGDGKIADLTITCNSSYNPADKGKVNDSRELSVMIKEFYFN